MHYFFDDGFIDHIRNAQRLTIEVAFRDYGVRQFQFDVTGLQWPPGDDIAEPIMRADAGFAWRRGQGHRTC